MYIFRGRGVFIDVYKADDKIATFGSTSLADMILWRTYRAIDSVATGIIPSLFCASRIPLFYIIFDSNFASARGGERFPCLAEFFSKA